MYNTKLSLHDGILCTATLATMFFFAVGVINISAKKKKKKTGCQDVLSKPRWDDCLLSVLNSKQKVRKNTEGQSRVCSALWLCF